MAPKPLEDLRRHIESTQSQYDDPAERDRALGVIETELNGMLGQVRTYRNDTQLQREGEDTERIGGEDDSQGSGSGEATS